MRDGRLTGAVLGSASSSVLAGVSVAGLLLPEAVAYAGIAGLAPGRAIVAAVAGGLIYALVGTSRVAVVSPTSSSAVLLAAALTSLAPGGGPRDAMAGALTLTIGLLLVAMSAFRLGGLAAFVSRPVLRGFAFGLAISIIVRQLPKLAGIAVAEHSTVPILVATLRNIGHWHWLSLGLGAVDLLLLLLLRRRPGVPAALILIIAGIILAWFADLTSAGIALAGPVTLVAPTFGLPGDFATWTRVAQFATPICLIVFAESWGTVRGLSLQSGDPVSANRELSAIGLANCAAALVQGMPVGAGFSVGSANQAAGASGRTAAVSAAVALLFLALFATPLIARIPEPVLAAVVIGALTHALSPTPLLRLFRIRRDQYVGVVAAVGVLGLGVLNGMLAALALGVAELLYRLSHPSISELGQVGTSHDYVDMARHKEAKRPADIMIYRPNAPLFFANAEPVLYKIVQGVRRSGSGVVILSLEESNDLDSTAVEALAEFARALESSRCRLFLARAHDRVRDILTSAGFGDLARRSTFSVADAVSLAHEEA